MQMTPDGPRIGVVDLAELPARTRGRVTTTQLTDAGRQISHVRFEAGADWRAETGMQWCEQPHRILVLSGSLEIEFLSGEVRQVHREDFADVPGSHNATASGQACTFLEFDPPSGTAASLPLCVLLWPHDGQDDGQDDGMAAYEDKVLALLPDHGGRLLARVRRSSSDDGPREVQLIELPDDAALNSYLADPQRTALAAVRDDVVARTDVIRIDQPIG